MSDSINDNEMGTEAARGPQPDAHGQAAMLLVESLLHALIARSVLSVDQAVEVVEVAAEVKVEIAADLAESPATLGKSLELLSAISASLKQDVRSKL